MYFLKILKRLKTNHFVILKTFRKKINLLALPILRKNIKTFDFKNEIETFCAFFNLSVLTAASGVCPIRFRNAERTARLVLVRATSVQI